MISCLKYYKIFFNMDTITKEQRHRNMSHIRAKNTGPEIIVRKYLFSRGLRYRLYDIKLPGRPDLIFKKYKTVLFINGCFWHQHPNCKRASIPKSNQEYWINKLENNKKRDQANFEQYRYLGWNVIVVWECELKPDQCKTTLERIYYEIIYSIGPYSFNLDIEQCTKNNILLAAEDSEDY